MATKLPPIPFPFITPESRARAQEMRRLTLEEWQGMKQWLLTCCESFDRLEIEQPLRAGECDFKRAQLMERIELVRCEINRLKT